MAVFVEARRASSPAAGIGLARHWRIPSWLTRDVLLPFFITRAVLLAVGLITATFVPRMDNPSSEWLSAQAWLKIWSIFDTRWYLTVAQGGYSYAPGNQSSAAFAPALPLLMRLGGQLFGGSTDAYLISGLIAGNVALLAALGYLVALVRQDFDRATAARAALYLLVFPSTLFLTAVYPESLFLAFAIASFYYARRGRWWLAAILGCAAGLTRLQGAALVVPLAFEYMRQRRFDVRGIGRDAVAICLVPVGALGFALFLFVQTGVALAALEAEGAWHRHLTWPWTAFAPFVLDPMSNHDWGGTALDFGCVVLLIALAALSWRRLPASLALFASIFALVLVSSGTLLSSARLVLEVFPIFITLALLGRKPLFHRAYLAVAGVKAIQLMMLFAQGGWVA